MAGLDGGGVRQLTHENDEALRHLQLTPLEPFSFVGAMGDSVYGYLMKPPSFDERNPAALEQLREAAAIRVREPSGRRERSVPWKGCYRCWCSPGSST